jgi:hypothetical protein
MVEVTERSPSLIDDYLQRLEENGKLHEPNVYYVTQLVKPCLLNVYYEIKNEVPPSKKLLRIFHMGHILEDVWIKDVLCHTPGIQMIATQLPAWVKVNDYEIHGRIDALSIKDNKLTIHEVKTAKTSSWKNTPNEEHVSQIAFYLYALGMDNGEIDVIDKSIMLLGEDPKNPGLSPDRIYLVNRGEQEHIKYNMMLENAELLHKAITTDTPPAPNPCWQCMGRISYCDHIEQCRREHPLPEVPITTEPYKPDNSLKTTIFGKNKEES